MPWDSPTRDSRPRPLYHDLGRNDKERQLFYRKLFRTELDKEAIDDIRLALNQNQPRATSAFTPGLRR